jgi:hypothetical protein
MLIALLLLFFIGAVITTTSGLQIALHGRLQLSTVLLTNSALSWRKAPVSSGTSLQTLGYMLGGISLIGILLISRAGTVPGLSSDYTFVGMTNATMQTQAQPQSQAVSIQTPITGNASQRLIRLGQVDYAGFYSAEYITYTQQITWQLSDCSTAAMTEVMDAYGKTYKIGDVLTTEDRQGAITPYQGLLTPQGITNTVAVYGFTTVLGQGAMSYDSLIALANAGTPVIVSFPPSRYPGGHIVVVTGGDANFVHLADSSVYNRQIVPRTWFEQHWGGFTAIVTPK